MEDNVEDAVGRKYILIKLPHETFKRRAINKDSLLYVAALLEKDFVHLPGFNDQCLRIGSLPDDILRSKVLMYKVDTPRTFTAIIAGSGFSIWNYEKCGYHGNYYCCCSYHCIHWVHVCLFSCTRIHRGSYTYCGSDCGCSFTGVV